MTANPQITVVFLLYNAEATVEALVHGLAAQVSPSDAHQAEWLRAIFVDDSSRDGTVEVLERALAATGNPPHYRVVLNERNLGLSGTLNLVLRQVETPYALTCHCDCFFGRPDYVAAMRDLLCRYPQAAMITGQPRLMPGRTIPFVEKMNAVVNLMDVVPHEAADEVCPIGFAEGRCDAVRMAALETVGFYRTTLRTSGEDQLLAAALRQHGYQVLQAPGLTYYLLLSDEQNSLPKLLRHQRLFGSTQPFILLRQRGTFAGALSKDAGKNRHARAALRSLQLLAAPLYPLALFGWGAGIPMWTWLAPLAVLAAGKLLLLRRHLRFVAPRPWEAAAILAAQPAFDISYAAGFAQGLILAARRRPGAFR